MTYEQYTPFMTRLGLIEKNNRLFAISPAPPWLLARPSVVEDDEQDEERHAYEEERHYASKIKGRQLVG